MRRGRGVGLPGTFENRRGTGGERRGGGRDVAGGDFPRRGGYGGGYGGDRGGYGSGDRGRKRKPEDQLSGPSYIPSPGQEQTVELMSNAFKVELNPRKFKRLDVFTVSFIGPRALSIEDEALKKRILGTRSIWGALTCPKLATFRDYEHAKLFVVSTPEIEARTQVEALDDSVVDLALRGTTEGTEQWTLKFSCETEHSALCSEPDKQTLWLQFASLVAYEALTAGGFTLGRRENIMRMSQPETWRQMRDGNFLVPGYTKSFCYTENGTFWAFAPKYSLLLNRDMSQELGDLMRQDPSYALSAGSDLSNVLRRRNLMCITSYCRTNIYKVVGVDLTKRATDEFSIREKLPNGDWGDHTETHISYLRSRYGGVCRELDNPALDSAPMVACVLVGRKNQAVKRTKTVYIPAPLLKLCCVNPSDLTRGQREDITRASQRKSADCIREIFQLVADLQKPEVREAFEYFGLDIQSDAASLEGRNNLRQTVVISLCPPGAGGGGRERGNAEIYLNDQGNFMRDFIRASTHSNPPPLNKFITIVRLTPNGRIPNDACRDFFNGLENECRRWGWQLSASMKPQDLRVIGWSGTAQHLDEIQAKLAAEFQDESRRPDLIWGLLADRDDVEYNLFKRFAYKLEIPSQVLTMRTLEKLHTKAFWKMIAAVAAKIVPTVNRGKPVNWTAPWELQRSPLEGRDHTVAIGVSTYQSSSKTKSKTGGYGLVATVNSACTGVVQDYGQSENISRGGIFGELKDKFEKLFLELLTRHEKKPDTLIIYRKGISESMFEQLEKAEITQIEAAIDNIIGKRQWNPSERTLTLSQPRLWREKGVYEFHIPCVVVNSNGQRSIQSVVKSAQPVTVLGPDGTKSSGYLEFTIRIPESEGTPDLHASQALGVKLPHGRKALLEKRPQLAYVVVNQASNSNLLFFGKRTRDNVPPAGTIIDSWFRGIDTKGKTRSEFFIIPSAGPAGFSGPVHYSIILNNTSMPIRELELISLRLCFLYYNQQGSVKTPFVLRFAEMGAEKACTLYRDCDDAALPAKKNKLRDTHFLL
eukprot:Gregarina_sp_Poly_1__2520@NODE_1682_length_3541_cov_71_121474_g1105_i0_p1_GENE_NODE_1682_length_3541_cov_71_121474_g1105_i0NODE_1682_length_3541_cov_71_121474_g1105_i0_p1_ORF_typecomplete_len1043_score150_07Piwi/PF02171_17/1_4e16Piwi/PF02171_17/1_8e14PAZ/PF02170_22/0_0067RE_AccI/PF09545_10/3_5e03RE_AccI/PF09545_10/0_12RhlB/PF12300_8/14_NODE_1682_length_3541_cov_71_121474_g1105_i01603288